MYRPADPAPANAQSKIAASATLNTPWAFTEEGKAIEMSKKPPPLPAGINEELMKEYFGMISGTSQHGYDPEKHFRKFCSYLISCWMIRISYP
jgi:hypothetical protein